MKNFDLPHPIFWVFFWLFVCSMIVLFFYGLFVVINNKIKQDEEILLLKKKLKEAENPREIWCPMRSKEMAGYAARVLITKDGREIAPIDPDQRILILVKDLPYVTPLTCPSWDPITSWARSSYKEIILFGAIYRYPK